MFQVIQILFLVIAETNGISFQSSTLPEYHVRSNATLFIACRPEYFDFQYRTNSSYLPIASLIRISGKNKDLSLEISGSSINIS